MAPILACRPAGRVRDRGRCQAHGATTASAASGASASRLLQLLPEQELSAFGEAARYDMTMRSRGARALRDHGRA